MFFQTDVYLSWMRVFIYFPLKPPLLSLFFSDLYREATNASNTLGAGELYRTRLERGCTTFWTVLLFGKCSITVRLALGLNLKLHLTGRSTLH